MTTPEFLLRIRFWKLLPGCRRRVLDLGTTTSDPVDFPDYAEKVGRALQDGRADRGILVCGSGIGACIAANKMKGVYASICHDTYSAAQGVMHDDMNLLCLGRPGDRARIGRRTGQGLPGRPVHWKCPGGERLARRVGKDTKAGGDGQALDQSVNAPAASRFALAVTFRSILQER